jgi:hypothetical protein
MAGSCQDGDEHSTSIKGGGIEQLSDSHLIKDST